MGIYGNVVCDRCLRPASQWAEPNRMGHLEIHGAHDSAGNLVGFLCPECASPGDR